MKEQNPTDKQNWNEPNRTKPNKTKFNKNQKTCLAPNGNQIKNKENQIKPKLIESGKTK